MRYLRPLLILGTAMVLVALQAYNGAAPAAATVGLVQSNAKLEAHSFDGQGTVNPSVVKLKNNFSEFNDDVVSIDDLSEGRSADGHGIQLTTIDTSQPERIVIATNGTARANWLDADPGDGKDPNGQARSELTVTVEVTGVPAPYTIAGSLSATATGSPVVCASALLTAPEGVSFLARAPGSCGQSTQDIDHSGELPVGTHTFSVSAIALAYNGNSGGGNEDVEFDLLITIGSEPVVEGIEFTQGIQQLQTVPELMTDLQGDGKPPVPIVANKPLAMRVYLGEVDTSSAFKVRVTGEIDQEINVTLNPGCTASDRRKQVNNCESVDFYFNPPEGGWNVRVRVTDQLDALVFDETFNLTSVKTDDVTLKAVSVCDTEAGPGDTWACQDASSLMQDASLMRRMFPTADVKVIVTGDVIRRNESEYSETIRWWGQVNRDLDALHSSTDEMFEQLGTEIYYVGLVREDIPGSTGGASYIDTRGAAARVDDETPWVVAHEVGHAMGLDHTNTAAPALSGGVGCWLGTRDNLPAYPYADNRLRSGAAPGQIEVGFDVASGVALNGEFFYDLMGYCNATAPQIAPDIIAWITPFSYLQLMSPNGPLSTGPVTPQAAPTSTPGDFWLVQGSSDGVSPDFLIDPLITVEGEGPTGAGSGTHRIEVRDGSNAILFTRLFTPAHGHGSPNPGEAVQSTGSAFTELVPVQVGAATIQVYDALQTLIATVDLTGSAPTVDSISLPATFSGNQSLSWVASDSDSNELTYWVEYSPDNGQTWHNQAIGLADTSLMLDFDKLAASDGQGVFRVTALDGAHSGQATSTPFSIAGKPPQAQIIGPAASSFRTGELVWLEATAYDIDDGTLDDGAVSWSSSVDGVLGTGASLPLYDLSAGTHTITMTATDSDNNTASDSITVTVSSGPIVEGGPDRDIDCSGAFNAADALALLKHLSGLVSGACRDIGSGSPFPFGNIDCNPSINLGDVSSLLAQAAGVQPFGCSAGLTRRD